jgi:glycosyltransferase involved in cell wall biosynthesis
LWGASPRTWSIQVIRTACDSLRLALLIRRHGVRLVVVNSAVLLSPVIAARLAGVPVIVRVRENFPGRPVDVVFALHKHLANHVMVVSAAIYARLRPGRNASVIVLGDGIELPPAPRREVDGEREGAPAPLRLCLIGPITILKRKGQDVAIGALCLLMQRGITATLELVGPIHSQTRALELQQLADRLGVGDLVRMTGPVNDVGPILRRTDIVLSCSRSEGVPLSLMEALAYERPVVATQVGGVPELIEHRHTGLLVPPEDAAAVAEAVAELASSPNAARAMAIEGRKQVASRFSIERGLARLRAEIEQELELARSG